MKKIKGKNVSEELKKETQVGFLVGSWNYHRLMIIIEYDIFIYFKGKSERL